MPPRKRQKKDVDPWEAALAREILANGDEWYRFVGDAIKRRARESRESKTWVHESFARLRAALARDPP